MDLVILAAGMGSRFGGLKQLEPIDNNGNFIIDYSVFDAIRAGFTRIIFIIKKQNLEDFKNTIGKRIEDKIKVEYVFQDIESFVDKTKYDISKRVKPFGTAHAILCCKDIVKDNFAIINADDFYGATSFKHIFDFLNTNKNQNNFAMIGYKVKNTITESGDVKRGICKINNGELKGFDESSIKIEDNKLVAKSINANSSSNGSYYEIDEDTLVSMNLFGFTKKVFELLENGFKEFLENNKDNLETCEFFIPTILTENIDKNIINIKVIKTQEKWFGLTYKSDFELVRKGLENLTKNNIYPKLLWENKK